MELALIKPFYLYKTQLWCKKETCTLHEHHMHKKPDEILHDRCLEIHAYCHYVYFSFSNLKKEATTWYLWPFWKVQDLRMHTNTWTLLTNTSTSYTHNFTYQHLHTSCASFVQTTKYFKKLHCAFKFQGQKDAKNARL